MENSLKDKLEGLKSLQQMGSRGNTYVLGDYAQVLPNATEAVQNFYYGTAAPSMPVPQQPEAQWTQDDVLRLSTYIKDPERLQAYIAMLKACPTAKDLGEIVVDMALDDDTTVNTAFMSKIRFTSLLVPFLTSMARGKSADNLRNVIDDAWTARKREIREREERG